MRLKCIKSSVKRDELHICTFYSSSIIKNKSLKKKSNTSSKKKNAGKKKPTFFKSMFLLKKVNLLKFLFLKSLMINFDSCSLRTETFSDSYRHNYVYKHYTEECKTHYFTFTNETFTPKFHNTGEN